MSVFLREADFGSKFMLDNSSSRNAQGLRMNNASMLLCHNLKRYRTTFCLPNKVLLYRIAPGATDAARVFTISRL